MEGEERSEPRVDRLEERSEEVGERIEEARESMETTTEESDQRPEEAPAEQVPDDAGEPGREDAEKSPGVPGEEETATGNPDAAGAEAPDEEESSGP